jgi:hypothetical protein
MTLLRLCLQVGPLTRGVCFLDHCDSSEPAGEPTYASQRMIELQTVVEFECLKEAFTCGDSDSTVQEALAHWGLSKKCQTSSCLPEHSLSQRVLFSFMKNGTELQLAQ